MLSFKWIPGLCAYAAVFTGSAILCTVLVHSLPPPESSTGDFAVLQMPRTFADVRSLHTVISSYQVTHSTQVLALFCASYVFLVTFMLPGAVFLNLLAGSLYPFKWALPLAVTACGMGSSCCYFLSRLLLSGIVHGLFPDRCALLRKKVMQNKQHLTNYMLFLRLTPFLPNWFINIASPVVGIPYFDFIVGSVIGQAPVNSLTVKAGQTIATMESLSDLYSLRVMLVLAGFAAMALVPVALQRQAAHEHRD